MKTQYYTATSLDGYIADANNSLEWLFQFGDPENGSYASFMQEVGAIAMGSTTYEWILNHNSPDSPDANLAQPAWSYTQPAWVFTTRTLPTIPGADIRFVKGDVRPVHEAMRAIAQDKNIWVVGGGDLVGQFYDHGLLDEIIVTVASVTLGSGAPLLPRRITTPPLWLLSATTYGTAFVELRYEVQRISSAD
ncbi:MAG: dihydrofolate reductase family protein [Elainellaceae cyanobacterium]